MAEQKVLANSVVEVARSVSSGKRRSEFVADAREKIRFRFCGLNSQGSQRAGSALAHHFGRRLSDRMKQTTHPKEDCHRDLLPIVGEMIGQGNRSCAGTCGILAIGMAGAGTMQGTWLRNTPNR